METPEAETKFQLISVNRRACEDILSSVKKRGRCVAVPVHGRPVEEGGEKKVSQSQPLAQSDQLAGRLPPPPQQINKKAVSFESKFLTKKSLEEEDDNRGGGATYSVKIPTFEKKKSDNLLFRKKKSCIYNENKYNKFMDAFKQQELKKIKKFHHVYKWKVALVILLILTISFTMIGIFIYYESSRVIEVDIDYDSEDTFKTFSVSHEMKQPVYVYYKINNFYSNFKTFLSDESQALINDFKCNYIKTFEDIYKFRCVNGVQTLPEMNNDFATSGWGDKNERFSSKETCDINSIPSDQRKRKIFPCGLVSASIFNDKIKLSLKKKIFNIDKFPVLNYYDFFSYIKKHKKYGSDYKVWLNTFSAEYKNWFHPPMTSSFIKPYGVIFEDLQPGEDYKIEFTQNTWPAKHWKAKKSFQLVSLRAVGNSAYELAYFFFLLAIIYLIVIIVMILLLKSGYYKLGKTFSYCKMSTVSNATEQTFFRKKSSMKRMEAVGSQKTTGAHVAEATHTAKGSFSVEPDGQREKSSSNERVSIVLGNSSRMCLCPMH